MASNLHPWSRYNTSDCLPTVLCMAAAESLVCPDIQFLCRAFAVYCPVSGESWGCQSLDPSDLRQVRSDALFLPRDSLDLYCFVSKGRSIVALSGQGRSPAEGSDEELRKMCSRRDMKMLKYTL